MGPRAHFLLAVIAFGTWLFIARLLRRGELRAKYSILWMSIGSVMVVLSVSPQILDRVSDWIGIDYAPATLFLGAIVLLLLIVAHFSWEISRLEDRTRTLAEEVALLNLSREEQQRP